MDTLLEVTPRDRQRKGENRRSRRGGSLPAVVYGPDHAPKPISCDPVKLTDLFKHTGDRNTIVSVKIGDDAPVPCLVREVQRHPVSRDLLHVDFYAVPREREIEVMVPINPRRSARRVRAARRAACG